MEPSSKIILEETFYVFTKKKTVFKVLLTEKGVHLIQENEQKEQLIPIKEIIGCKSFRGKKSSKKCVCQSIIRSKSLEIVEDSSGDLDSADTSAYLYIYAYLLQKKPHRERTIVTLRFRSFDKFEDNQKEALKWRVGIKNLIKTQSNSEQNVFIPSNELTSAEKRLLVLCNPKSGSGRAKDLFRKKVVPILEEAEVGFDLFLTKCKDYARDFVRESDLSGWSGIVAIGGDGILFEVLNGIMERRDWLSVTQSLPIAVVPGGSGNGLARSLAHYSSEPYGGPACSSRALPAALSLVCGRQRRMDIVRVETRGEIMFSFLSVGWGLLSDIDVESEKLRVLGGQRFTIWSVARLIGLRSYGGKLWYLPAEEGKDEEKEKDKEDEEDAKNRPIYSSAVGSDSDIPGEIRLETKDARPRVDSWYSAASRRSAYFSASAGSSYRSTAEVTSPEGDASPDARRRPRMFGPASRIPGLLAAPPSSWSCLEGRFVMVHASYQSHLGEEFLFAPQATMDDGKIWLLVILAGATRSQLLHFLLGLSTGAHATSSDDDRTESGALVRLLPVSAFRIEPDASETGYLTVDGELVEYGPIQAEIFNSVCRVMVP